MKKNNSYLADDDINISDIVKSLWREKILTLSISIICGLAGYLYVSFQPQEFRTEIQLKNIPHQIFEPYTLKFGNNNDNNINSTTTSINNNNNNNNNNNIVGQFIFDFKLNFLSLDSLQSFIDESREFDNFKEYLKLRNISAKKYFVNKIGEVKEKNLIIPNKYFLLFQKELDGDIFFYNYSQFIKKKTVFEIKKKLKFSIENKITILQNALEKAKLINLEDPILRSMKQSNQVVNEPEDLFYKGSKILSQEIIYLKRLLIELENDQFNYEIVSDKPLHFPLDEMSNLKYFLIGIMFGLFLSLVVIFFRVFLKNN
jgi:LPS O-antigen subunit length determinant protein (WzzB/FepE family)